MSLDRFFRKPPPYGAVDLVLIGLIAGALTSSSFVPQIVKGWRTKRLGDVSPGMLVVMMSGLALWTAYGVARADQAIIIANLVGLVFTGTLLALWFRYGRAAPTV